MSELRMGIVIGGDYGDAKSGALYMPMKYRLNQLFEEHCSKSYSPNLDSFSIVLRVSGRIWNFDSEGVERLRRSRKKRYITVDIVIPQKRWKNVPAEKVRDDLAAIVRKALEQEVTRLAKDREDVKQAEFWTDVDKVLQTFLAEKVPSGFPKPRDVGRERSKR